MASIRDFYNLKIFLNSLISFNIYRSKHIFRVLYYISNKKSLSIVYLIKL